MVMAVEDHTEAIGEVEVVAEANVAEVTHVPKEYPIIRGMHVL